MENVPLDDHLPIKSRHFPVRKPLTKGQILRTDPPRLPSNTLVSAGLYLGFSEIICMDQSMPNRIPKACGQQSQLG